MTDTLIGRESIPKVRNLRYQKAREKGKIGVYAYFISEIAAMALSGYMLLSGARNPEVLNAIKEGRFMRGQESALVRQINAGRDIPELVKAYQSKN